MKIIVAAFAVLAFAGVAAGQDFTITAGEYPGTFGQRIGFQSGVFGSITSERFVFSGREYRIPRIVQSIDNRGGKFLSVDVEMVEPPHFPRSGWTLEIDGGNLRPEDAEVRGGRGDDTIIEFTWRPNPVSEWRAGDRIHGAFRAAAPPTPTPALPLAGALLLAGMLAGAARRRLKAAP